MYCYEARKWRKMLRNMLIIPDDYWTLRKHNHYRSTWKIQALKHVQNYIKPPINPVFLLSSNYVICNDLYQLPFYENCENCDVHYYQGNRQPTWPFRRWKKNHTLQDNPLCRPHMRLKIPVLGWFHFSSNFYTFRYFIEETL